MAQFVNIFDVDLMKPSAPRQLQQIVCEGDAQGNRIGAYVYSDGECVALGGQCVGKVVRADGATVSLTGTIDGNLAYVVLDQQSCAIEGPVQVAVCWVSSSNVTTLVVAYGTVVSTQTGNAIQPSTPIPDLTQLLAEIENMRAATAAANAAAEGALSNFAGAFDATQTYTAGQYVTYTDCKFYRLTDDHAANVTWANTSKIVVTAGSELSDLMSAISDQLYYIGEVLQYRKKVFLGAIYSGNGEIVPSEVRKLYCFQVKPNQVLSAAGNFDMYGWFADEPEIGSIAESYVSESTFESVTVPAGIRWLVFRTNYVSAVVTISPESRFDGIDNSITVLQSNIATLQSDALYAKKALKTSALSLNGNYFNPITAEWLNGIYSSQGTVSGDYPYQYAYAKIVGAGNYVRVVKASTFGDNAIRVVLCDKNKNFVKYITGTLDGDYCSFTLTDSDFSTCAYIIMHRKATQTFSPKLFYKATACGTEWEFLPIYGFDSDKLYKKTMVCDGDSICAATPDNPKTGWGGWFGRFKMGYQMTGHNYGVGGGTITAELYYQDLSPRHWICTSLDTIKEDYSDLDFLLLEGGTNDADVIGPFVDDTPPAKFGTWSENDFSGSYDNTTFCGAVDQMFYKAITYFPNTKIGFIVAMEMGRNESAIANRKRYFDEIVKIAKKWHIPVLNLWDTIGVDARLSVFYDSSKTSQQNADAGMFYLDGQHPTSWGYDRMQNRIDEWVRSL